MKQLKLLDLFCCQGGAGMGYYLAGFEVTGVDIIDQPRYPFTFIKFDAFDYIMHHGHEYDIIHASPPCQLYSLTHQIKKGDHPDYIRLIREALIKTGKPFIIENVEGAADELLNPILLCGNTFGLRTYRHRLFECSFHMEQPAHIVHDKPLAKMGRPVKDGEFMHVVGNFSGVGLAKKIMGMDWANRDGLREAIPPCYTQYIGNEYLRLYGYS